MRLNKTTLRDVQKVNQQIIPNPEQPGGQLVVVQKEFKMLAYFKFATAGQQTTTINVLQDSDFAIETLSGVWTSPKFHIQIKDASTGEFLFNSPMPAEAVIGTGQLPHEFRSPVVVRANGTIEIQVSNDVAQANEIEIAFNGSKIYCYEAQ